MTPKTLDSILENFLKVIAGASQIAIDRGADSGVIDFKEVITQAKSEIVGLLPKEKRTKQLPGNEEGFIKGGKIEGWNAYRQQVLKNLG